MIIMMLAGYINGFLGEYKYSMIAVTVSAVASASFASGATIGMAFERLLFVGIGAILAILANRFIYNSPKSRLATDLEVSNDKDLDQAG